MMDTVDEIDGYFSNYIPQVIQSTIIPLMLLIVIFIEHIAGLIIIFTAPFIPIFMMVIGLIQKINQKNNWTKWPLFPVSFLIRCRD